MLRIARLSQRERATTHRAAFLKASLSIERTHAKCRYALSPLDSGHSLPLGETDAQRQ
jgi:hypothetical protein